MKRAISTLLLIATFLTCGVARADIVYSARYYNPPNSPKPKSHYHLYRIRPDGSNRRQITFGRFDDESPRWSPDGRTIAFLRYDDRGKAQVCTVAGSGGSVRVITTVDGFWNDIAWEPNRRHLRISVYSSNDDKPQWHTEIWDTVRRRRIRSEDFEIKAESPDHRYYVCLPNDGHAFIVRRRDGKRTQLPANLDSFVWVNQHHLVGMDSGSDPADERNIVKRLSVLGNDGTVVKEWTRFHAADGSTVTIGGVNAFDLMKDGMDGTVIVQMVHRDVCRAMRVRLSDGLVSPLLDDAYIVTWSPNGKQYIALPPRNSLEPYGKTGKDLYVGRLLLGGQKETDPKPITQGMVHCINADWH